ncbi:MAG: SDR family oxidoreductase [Lachnospiraceae bacterium]|jgi:nucleoside-diphosphate-sugar epimerase
MKALFIGGTGTISTEVTKLFVKNGGDLYLLNRGQRKRQIPEGVKVLIGDINDEEGVAKLLEGHFFDVIVDFQCFNAEQAERDFRLFHGKTKQYIVISSAAGYMKPCANSPIVESMPLRNPYWEYARDKIALETVMHRHFREDNFPVTIVRPSHTYGERNQVVDCWTVLTRIRKGKPVIIHGDGTTLWTLTHSRDFAKAFVGLMGNIHAIGDTVHITSDEALTWNQIFEIIADIFGVKLNAVHVSTEFIADTREELRGGYFGDRSNNVVFDNSRIKSYVPDFVAKIPFAEGYKEVVAYYLAHPELQEEDPDYSAWCDAVAEEHQAAIERVNKRLGNLVYSK